MQSIVVVGAANIDLTAFVPRFPQAGETLAGDSLLVSHGGKGANQALAAARAGAHVRIIARVGDDEYGRDYVERLRAEGLDVSGMALTPDVSTGTALILVERTSGENQIVYCTGANERMSVDDVERGAAAFTGAVLLLVQMEVPHATVLRAMTTARAAGARTILNPSPLPSDPAQVPLELTDILIVNEGEACALAGAAGANEQPAIDDDARIGAAAQALRQCGPQWVIVTRGSQPTVLVTQAGMEKVEACSVQPVDTVGAGDTFAGAFAAALARGDALSEGVRWANAAAALSTQKAGAQTAMPLRAEVDAFLSKVTA